MRRLLLAAAALTAACSGPRPCTQALCPSRQDGTYRVSGWNRSVVVPPGTPPIPIVSDSTVEVLDGRVEFVNDRAFVRADAGSSFLFSVSTGGAHEASIVVSSGVVAVALSSGAAPSYATPGAPFILPQ